MLCILWVIVLSGCSLEIKDVELPVEFLETATAYKVGGINTVFDDKHLNYGPYRSVAIRRGGVAQSSSGLLIRKHVAKQRVSFTMVDDSGLRSNSQATGVLGEEDVSVLSHWFGDAWWYIFPRKKYTNYYAGAIDVEGVGVYKFLIPDAYKGWGDKADELSGLLKAEHDDTQYNITTFNMQFEGGVWMQNTSAFNLVKEGVTLAAVQTNHPEKVWINNAASKQDQFIAANLMGLLLLRQSLQPGR